MTNSFLGHQGSSDITHLSEFLAAKTKPDITSLRSHSLRQRHFLPQDHNTRRPGAKKATKTQKKTFSGNYIVLGGWQANGKLLWLTSRCGARGIKQKNEGKCTLSERMPLTASVFRAVGLCHS